MTEESEPTENIGGGHPSSTVEQPVSETDATTRAEAVVDRLGDLYWRKAYGGRDAFACLVRTILSQNTSDAASQPAYDALEARYRSESTDFATALAAADEDTVAALIQPAGLQNQKAATIISTATTIIDQYGDADTFDDFVQSTDRDQVRRALLELNGVGPKTADCVLLFAGGTTGVFPVDTHVHRIYRRLGIANPDADPDAVRTTLESAIPPEKCGFGHTATIQFGREYCTARAPACFEGPDACPLADRCDQVGVDPASESITDPSDALSE